MDVTTDDQDHPKKSLSQLHELNISLTRFQIKWASPLLCLRSRFIVGSDAIFAALYVVAPSLSAMDDGGNTAVGRWGFGSNGLLASISASSIRAVLNVVMSEIREDGPRPVLPLGHGDPSCFPCFRTTSVAEEAIVDAVRSANFNSYASTVGIVPARW